MTPITHTVIFAGPSVHGLDPSAFPGLVWRGPAACGDLLQAVQQGARVIGLIDGLYGDCAAVWHKEILFALSQGVAVYGAASMGALRAAECDLFGMQGVGRIYEAYRDGLRVSDADVALSHAPADLDYRPLTLALVDAEATLAALALDLAPARLARLLSAARALHFSRRTWRAVALAAGEGADVAQVLAERAVSPKQADALALLTLLQNECSAAPQPGWRFQNTLFFRSLAVRVAGQR